MFDERLELSQPQRDIEIGRRRLAPGHAEAYEVHGVHAEAFGQRLEHQRPRPLARGAGSRTMQQDDRKALTPFGVMDGNTFKIHTLLGEGRHAALRRKALYYLMPLSTIQLAPCEGNAAGPNG